MFVKCFAQKWHFSGLRAMPKVRMSLSFLKVRGRKEKRYIKMD